MLERMTRGKFAKLAAAAPFVVLAMKSDGSREASAQASPCTLYAQAGICGAANGGPCTPVCKIFCTYQPYRNCAICDTVRNGGCPA